MPTSAAFLASKLERDPNRLLRLLVLVGAVSMLLILSLTGYGIYLQESEQVLQAAETDAERISQVMLTDHYDFLFQDNQATIVLSPSRISEFRNHVSQFLKPFNIVKIKVFDSNRTIVFSTEEDLIGEQIVGNQRLEKALRGEVDSQLEEKGEILDLAQEKRFDVDIVETYLPVYNKAGGIGGAFELYLDVTQYQQIIKDQLKSSLLILTVILMSIFVLAYTIVFWGTKEFKILLQRLQYLAIVDPLTGCLNRRAILQRAREELNRMKRDGQGWESSLGLIMLDLDHFKLVNDRFGHQVGDQVLREVTRRAQACLREYDTLGRYGGEEFLVVVPGSNVQQAAGAAERIRYELLKAPISLDDAGLKVTASLGVACCRDPYSGLDEALRRADQALYQAKENGRNCVVSEQ